ncbi:MAG: TolB family protein, partial [Burkholderiaceae bacterium]
MKTRREGRDAPRQQGGFPHDGRDQSTEAAGDLGAMWSSTVRVAMSVVAATSFAVIASCGGHDDGAPNPPPASGGPQISLGPLSGSTKDVTVDMKEGTNMAVSPSPDGTRLVFSAQGALWVMPVTGGNATRITAFDVEPTAPVWSPDGKTIAFQNYTTDGNFHIWSINPDGTGAQ